MRLLNHRGEGVGTKIIGRHDRVYAWDLLADAPAAMLGGVGFIGIGIAIGSIYGFRSGIVVGLSGIVCLALGLFCRSMTNPNWIVAVAPMAVVIQIFRNIGLPTRSAAVSNAIELQPTEIAELAPGVVDIVWSSLRRQRIKYLFVALRVDNAEDQAIVSSLSSFSGYSCTVPRQRIAIVHSGKVLIEWSYRRPTAKRFLQKAKRICPALHIGRTTTLSVDFTDLIMMTEEERNSKLLLVKQLGLGLVCIDMLKRRMRMSSTEARELMRSL